MRVNVRGLASAAAAAGLLMLSGCAGGGSGQSSSGGSSSGEQKVEVDGSSTVYVLSQAVTEEFEQGNSEADVAVKSSGTGGGFKRFCAGELDITGASRP